jgi:hypothetical protein
MDPVQDGAPLPTSPFTSCFNSVSDICVLLSLNLRSNSSSVIREELSVSLRVLGHLVERLTAGIAVPWDPDQWLSAILQCTQNEVGLISAVSILMFTPFRSQ